jgi:hypothetical protein
MDQIGSLLNRPKAYYNIDGVGELGCGFMSLSYALFHWLQVRTPEHSVWHQTWVFCLYLGLMVSIIHYGSKAVKQRITYPRTGFVEYRKRDTFWRMFIAMGVSALISVGLALALRSRWDVTAPASLFGPVLAAAYGYGIARTVPWKWAVFAAMAFGSLAIAILPEDLIGPLADHSWAGTFMLSMMLYGTLLMLSGGISFWLYLRHTQAPAQDIQ